MGQGVDDYGTFFPLWAAALHRTTGPVFEMGCGHYSTPLTHFVGEGRHIISAETDPEWIAKFKEYAVNDHEFHLVKIGPGENKDFQWRAGWLSFVEDTLIRIPYFGCALIDGFPGEVRVHVAEKLRKHCKFLVLHDTEGLDVNGDDGGNYGWEHFVPTFKYAYTWRVYRPWTTVVSDEEKFKP